MTWFFYSLKLYKVFNLHVYIKDECFPRPPLKIKLTDNFKRTLSHREFVLRISYIYHIVLKENPAKLLKLKYFWNYGICTVNIHCLFYHGVCVTREHVRLKQIIWKLRLWPTFVKQSNLYAVKILKDGREGVNVDARSETPICHCNQI